MAYKTTDTTAFNLDLNQLVEESFERCGAELRSGYDLRTARRSLNLLTIEWANRGLNLWTIEQGSQVLTYNVADYDMPVDTIDLLDHVIRTGTGTNQTDINISRIRRSRCFKRATVFCAMEIRLASDSCGFSRLPAYSSAAARGVRS